MGQAFLADDGLNDFENQARIELNNRNLSRMSEMVVEMIQPDLRIRIPDDDIISDPGHRWGKHRCITPWSIMSQFGGCSAIGSSRRDSCPSVENKASFSTPRDCEAT